MTYEITIDLHGPLLVAGGPGGGLGADLATARRWAGGERRAVPYIPATALRGAIRLQLEALLAGTHLTPTGPYALENNGADASQLTDSVAALFGCSGPAELRSGSKEGKVRLSDAWPIDEVAAAAALRVRANVAIDPVLASAADQKLFFRELVETGERPLQFRAELEVHGATAEELRHLEAALGSTEAVGAGKAVGGGAISIRFERGQSAAGATVEGDPASAGSARLAFELLEPAHFGDGGPRGNHQGTRSYIPGATVRGALAWALLRSGRVSPSDAPFRELFLGEVSFGDALPGAAGANPRVRPLTLAERRSDVPSLCDKLPLHLARGRINRELEGTGLAFREDDGSQRFDPVEARSAEGLLRHTRTRVSIDRETGAAAAQRLFSIEQIEPFLAAGSPAANATTFVATIEGLSPSSAAASLLAELRGLPVFVGAGRNHGLGRVSLGVAFEGGEQDVAAAVAQVERLSSAVERLARDLRRRGGLPPAQEPAPADAMLLALVAQSDYLPEVASADPFAELGIGKARLLRRFLQEGSSGGYDELSAREQGAAASALKPLEPTLAAGSVFVYEVERSSLPAILERALPTLRRGVGRGIPTGHGRFALWVDSGTNEETMR